MMDTERTAEIKIGGKSYELLLTTGATKEIAKRYGGLENLGNTMLRSCHQKCGTDAAQLSDSGDKLMKSENFEMAIGEIVWLITLLANQPILIRNLTNEEKQPLLTAETVELLTTPLDLAEYKNAITTAMYKGTKRNVESEDNSKNALTAE